MIALGASSLLFGLGLLGSPGQVVAAAFLGANAVFINPSLLQL